MGPEDVVLVPDDGCVPAATLLERDLLGRLDQVPKTGDDRETGAGDVAQREPREAVLAPLEDHPGRRYAS